MTKTTALRGILFDNIRRSFFARLARAPFWRVSYYDDNAACALHNLGGLASPW